MGQRALSYNDKTEKKSWSLQLSLNIAIFIHLFRKKNIFLLQINVPPHQPYPAPLWLPTLPPVETQDWERKMLKMLMFRSLSHKFWGFNELIIKHKPEKNWDGMDFNFHGLCEWNMNTFGISQDFGETLPSHCILTVPTSRRGFRKRKQKTPSSAGYKMEIHNANVQLLVRLWLSLQTCS